MTKSLPRAEEHGGRKDGSAGGLLAKLARAPRFRQLFPESIRRLGRRVLPRDRYLRELAIARDTFANAEQVSTYPPKVGVCLGIVKDLDRWHGLYIGACRDLGIPYKVVDISGSEWISVVRDAHCDAFLVRPSVSRTVWKQMFDERLKIMMEDLGKIIYPSYNELWIYESKRRMAFWLETHGIAGPRTWVFYSEDEATDFARQADLPIVYKSDLGSGALGVCILRKRSHLLRLVKRCFRRGFVRRDGDPRDREWGSMILQQYIADATEWRVLRLGNSYFAHQKLKCGDFHSGTGLVKWYDPPRRLLDLARCVTDMGNFTSMNLDVLGTPDGRFLVNELQSVFSAIRPYQMLVNGKAGRYLYDYDAKSWRFDEGIFCQNGCCNLRVAALVARLGHHVELPNVCPDSVVSTEDKQASIRDYAEQLSWGKSHD